MGVFTSTVPSHAAGEEAAASKLQTLDDLATALTGAWTTWSPTLTNLTQGNGTMTAVYRQMNKTVDVFWQLVLGGTSAVGTTPSITLPVAANSLYSAYPPWTGMLNDASTSAKAPAVLNLTSTTTLVLQYFSALNTAANIAAASPWVWTTSDVLSAQFTYFTA